ncbi:MAG: TonB-dependent receptor, partial [Bacteroidales bacterium]|nr:TonB-dependent receptor [Bacteroidales bacterium]
MAESFETNPSVDVSYSDAVTGAKQIRLLGLDGTYVQLLSENFPIYNGLARIYGLDYIPGPWMESILVSKGTSSVKNGYEAITGQINVEYKKPPDSDILTANLFAADNGRIEANADATALLNDRLSTGLFLHFSSEQKQMDSNDDGFLDIPQKRQYNIFNRWYYRMENFISQLGVQYIHDDRTGGQTDKALPAESAHSLYKTDMNVDRVSFFTKNGFILNPDKNESLALIVSGAYHDQNSNFGFRKYDATEKSLYASFLYEKDFSLNNKISTGISLNHMNIEESFIGPFLPEMKETTTGIYAEYTYNNQDDFTLLAGLRADYSNLFDLFVTPRLHLKYNFTEWFHIRGTIGKGYR